MVPRVLRVHNSSGARAHVHAQAVVHMQPVPTILPDTACSELPGRPQMLAIVAP